MNKEKSLKMSRFESEHEKIRELVLCNMSFVSWRMKALEREATRCIENPMLKVTAAELDVMKQRNEKLSEDILFNVYRLAAAAHSLAESCEEIEVRLSEMGVCNGKS